MDSESFFFLHWLSASKTAQDCDLSCYLASFCFIKHMPAWTIKVYCYCNALVVSVDNSKSLMDSPQTGILTYVCVQTLNWKILCQMINVSPCALTWHVQGQFPRVPSLPAGDCILPEGCDLEGFDLPRTKYGSDDRRRKLNFKSHTSTMGVCMPFILFCTSLQE